ncbi:DUF465 domain-containing protein [Syntrophorhabdus aromaticivorans]|jgi:hypothetical protein|uniref:DUF465 domain-containing protein n=1 Tax=Syntrophorhabdus aromaticivorans TaxID=328301 RepID=A0A351TZ22_9BACT|nr:DUF465 domain-containing protein [Syntrophorhabdus aromaticivorans]NLW34625.1 DUF465 domain-containing protein [Syntrophorhabdus aromaticivorans]HBA52953.1 DUF465 domain-containing protein [Syntrophorhabdus aromaticivorans]
MEQGESRDDIYNGAKTRHATLERRLQMLLKKPYLTADEEFEVKVLKKKKLYFKDIMERVGEEVRRGEKH